MASLSYAVFLSCVMRHFNIDFTGEVTMGYNKTNLISNLALHQMGLRKSEIAITHGRRRQMPLNVDKSNAFDAKMEFQLKKDFERFMSARMDKLERSIAKIHKKLDDGFDNDDVFGSDTEDDMEDEGCINIYD
ncbi:hypothetical protein V8G54_001529 [Vigna mungo]|uniref:Uncharacterized protein n=1 Tax=Vigna mungo TaxID=3915 RepID=A0AAQ3P8G8_VIGMU